MENATEGLLMAGSVLIGVIVISLFVYMATSMGATAKDFQQNMDVTAIQKFNESFEKYIGREDLTPHDLLTVYNLVNEKNKQAEMEVITMKGITSQDFKDLTKFLLNEDKKEYKCDAKKVKYNEETGKISHIEFEKVK